MQRSKAGSRRQHRASEKVNVKAKKSVSYPRDTGQWNLHGSLGVDFLKQSLYRPNPEQDECTIPVEVGMFLKSFTDSFSCLSRVGVQVV